MWIQKQLVLAAKPRGFHLVTEEVKQQLQEIQKINIGLMHLLLKHTSASLSLNENADASVRQDLESYLNRQVPQNEPYFRHLAEGPDDMPAHIKSGLLGVELSLPICKGEFCLGVWQGIYLGEHRDHGGARRIVATLQGESCGH